MIKMKATTVKNQVQVFKKKPQATQQKAMKTQMTKKIVTCKIAHHTNPKNSIGNNKIDNEC